MYTCMGAENAGVENAGAITHGKLSEEKTVRSRRTILGSNLWLSHCIIPVRLSIRLAYSCISYTLALLTYIAFSTPAFSVAPYTLEYSYVVSVHSFYETYYNFIRRNMKAAPSFSYTQLLMHAECINQCLKSSVPFRRRSIK